MSEFDIDSDAAKTRRFRRQIRSTLIKRKGVNEMGKAIRASALVLLLACSANAGIMQMDAAPPPPPPPVESDGIMQTGLTQPAQGTTTGQLETSLLVQIALNLLTLL
jgi:hypothetical protein